MKTLISFLSVLLCVAPFGVANAVVSSTAGNNLTAYNNSGGAANNNRWNNAMNSRSGGNETNATADFGNCNALIMRCAQPKCSNGGCTDMSVTFAIVNGCVQSSAQCKQYGDELTQYISAQLVAQNTAKANANATAAQNAAAQAAAQQSAQQMAQMQAQMQQMQVEMAAQNAQTVAQLQSALEEQKQLTANAIAEATAVREAPTQQTAQSSAGNDLSASQLAAAERGVSADILAREQISGQILSSIENAETQLKALKATMNDAFSYAGCDSRGNNCTGPKRVKMFKQKAEGFFDPYESVLDELYDALILAQSVGVDITDIYMMLNGSCNVWGKYLCSLGKSTAGDCLKWGTTTTKSGNTEVTQPICIEYGKTEWPTYKTSGANQNCVDGKSKGPGVRGGHDCVDGQVIPPEDDISCVLQETLNQVNTEGDNEVQRSWLWADMDADSGANIRVGCASSALESSTLFRNRKKQAKIDIETLQRIVSQDESITSRGRSLIIDEDLSKTKYCAVGEKSYPNLKKWVATKGLPTNICMNERTAENQVRDEGVLTLDGELNAVFADADKIYQKCKKKGLDDCEDSTGIDKKTYSTSTCCLPAKGIMCLGYGYGEKWEAGGTNEKCTCKGDTNVVENYRKDKRMCMSLVDYCAAEGKMPKSKNPKTKEDNDCWGNCNEYCTEKKFDMCRIETYGKLQKIDSNTEKCVDKWDENKKQCTCTKEKK